MVLSYGSFVGRAVYLKRIYIYSVDEQLRKIMEIRFSLIRGRVVNGPEFDPMSLGSICPEFESPC